jgi:predicted membrane channel-forming protein YqfA (hemolysin III family)
MAAMNTQTPKQKRMGIALTAAALMLAFWLVSPFIHLDKSDFGQGKILGYRLFVGLMIMLVFIGKSLFDTLAPQGLARRVSTAKGIALIVLTVLLTGFVIYIFGQATVLYLSTAAGEEQQQQQTIINVP